MLSCSAFFLVSMFFGVSANRRSTYIQLVDNADAFNLNLGQPRSSTLRAKPSTRLSEFIVIDAKCGQAIEDCPKYCRNSHFFKLYCFPLCYVADARARICKYDTHRYHPDRSLTAQLIESRGWRRVLANYRPLAGSHWRDTVRLHRFWRSAEPLIESVLLFNMTFVSALMFDSRLIIQATALMGLRPGANSAVQQILEAVGAQRPLISLSNGRPNDMVKTMVDNGLLYWTVGAVDMWRCVDWRWIEAPDFVVVVPTIDFMGVVFRNVVMPFDLDNEYYHISQAMADTLVEAGVFNFSRTSDGYVVYKYDCHDDVSVQFLDSDDSPFLELYTDALTMVGTECESTVTVDIRDISADPRADHLIWNMGFGFMEQSCLGYDYGRMMVGFGMLRPWAHPLLGDARD